MNVIICEEMQVKKTKRCYKIPIRVATMEKHQGHAAGTFIRRWQDLKTVQPFWKKA